MTPWILAAEPGLPLFHQAMRDEFQKGGSFGSVLLTLLGLAGLVFLVYFLQKWYDASQVEKELSSDPLLLFGGLLKKLSLSPESRTLLTELVRDREIENPAALLISSQLFDTHASSWLGNHLEQDRSQQLAQIRARLFGGDLRNKG